MEYVIRAVKLSFTLLQNNFGKKGKNGTKLFKLIFLSTSTEIFDRDGLLPLYFKNCSGKNTTGQFYCEPDLETEEIEVYL